MKVKNIFLLICCACVALTTQAQSDPIVMTIRGVPVPRSEFEYSYNKNNSVNVIDKKSLEEYVDLFVNYKLKVLAAIDAKLDTLSTFKHEFAEYRDQQIKPHFITDADVENEAKRLYREAQQRVDANGGLMRVAHILIRVPQKASAAQQSAFKQRIDSIYNVLRKGGDFATMATRFSDDSSGKRNGGELPWIEKGQTFPEFETEAWKLTPGQMSAPFLSPAGWHIILAKEKRNYLPYDSIRTNILSFIEMRGIREKLIQQKINNLSKSSPNELSPETILADKQKELEQADPQLKYLIKEYHDGLLMFEMSNRMVWDKAAKDEEGLQRFFKKNKKRYYWDQPRFKGIAFRTRNKNDIKAVKKTVKRQPFNTWPTVLASAFNNDSLIRIKAEKGIFKQGDNSIVDRHVFKASTPVSQEKEFPYEGVYGKKLKKKPQTLDDVREQVVADYQEHLEKQWVETLRKKYPVIIHKEALSTVNKHL